MTELPGPDDAIAVAEVAARTGLSPSTLRYYEQEGLLPPVARSPSGHRRYRQVDLDRLAFLLRLRATGMPVATMRRFAALRRQGETGRPGRLQLLVEHREQVRRTVASLQENLTAIDAKIVKHRRLLRRREEPTVTEPAFAFHAVHHVQLAVPRGSEEQCRAFWGGLLGMQELAKPPVLAARGGCWFRGGALEVHLGVEEPFVPARKAHPGLLVEGLRELADRLAAGGHPVTWDDDFPGHDRCYAADPFGNRLEFLEPRD